MRQINFSDVGVPVNSMEELDEIYLTYSALDISFADIFKNHCIEAQQHKLVGYCIQTTRGDIKTKLDGNLDVFISVINYPIRYSMDSLNFAVAYQLLMSNQEDELIAHLNKYCKEYK